MKGYRGEDAIAKAETMKSYWIPGVNNLGCYGRWAFHEFTSAEDMKGEFDNLGKEARNSADAPKNVHRRFAGAMVEKYQSQLA